MYQYALNFRIITPSAKLVPLKQGDNIRQLIFNTLSENSKKKGVIQSSAPIPKQNIHPNMMT
jgi:hypothetical protein